MGTGVIYMITNKVNDKKYIGQTIQEPKVRFLSHLNYASKSENIKNMPLAKAIQEYGKENFELTILEECPQEMLDEREAYYVKKYNSFYEGYNSTLGGVSGNKLDIDFEEMVTLYHKLRSTRKVAKYYGVDKTAIGERLKKMGIPFYKENEQSNNQVSVYKNGELIAVFECKKDCAKWFVENKIGRCRKVEGIRKSIKTRKDYYGYDIIVNNKI